MYAHSKAVLRLARSTAAQTGAATWQSGIGSMPGLQRNGGPEQKTAVAGVSSSVQACVSDARDTSGRLCIQVQNLGSLMQAQWYWQQGYARQVQQG